MNWKNEKENSMGFQKWPLGDSAESTSPQHVRSLLRVTRLHE